MFEAAAFAEPALVSRKAAQLPHVEEMRVVARNRRSEILQYARRIDAVGRLDFFPSSAIPSSRRTPLIATPKDAECDRTVFDRRGQNRYEVQLSSGVAWMCSGEQLIDMQVASHARVMMCSEDIEDCFPAVHAPSGRTCTNGLAAVSFSSDVAEFLSAKRCTLAPSTSVVLCCRGLAPGEINAAD